MTALRQKLLDVLGAHARLTVAAEDAMDAVAAAIDVVCDSSPCRLSHNGEYQELRKLYIELALLADRNNVPTITKHSK